jgi:hypothetical protein
VAAAHGPQLVAAELAEQGWEPRANVLGQLRNKPVPATRCVAYLATEEPAKV